jgi:hypothetical protein
MISREQILFMHEFAKFGFDPECAKDHDSATVNVLSDVSKLSTTEIHKEHMNLLKIHQ